MATLGKLLNTCLLEVMTDITAAREKKQYVGVIAIDMSSAYCLVGHLILSQKLRILGLSNHTLAWVMSFLADRSQAVDIQGKMSTTLMSGEQGVIQGGSSSGDLFLLYLNDLPLCLPRPGMDKPNVSASMYVDDVTIVAFANSISALQTTLQNAYLDMEYCLSRHKMQINGSKTQMVIISNKPEHKLITIEAGGTTSHHQDDLKVLGLIISSNLKFDSYIRQDKNSLIKKIKKRSV